jgi:hypothetical protein
MKKQLLSLALIAMLGACGSAEQSDEAGSTAAFDAGGSAEEAAAPRQAGAEIPAQVPQIAYTYSFGFRLPSDKVSATQEAHLKLCERQGPSRCRVVTMERSASSGNFVSGRLELQVAAPLASAFGDRLVASAASAGADTVDRGITTEELSKQIVDADARIRTKQALVDRLTALLATRSGDIAQAVEAERAINAAQEELERARAWVAEMRGRVAMSKIEISYESESRLAGGFTEPLRKSLSAMGGLVGSSLALIVTIVAVLLPWLVLAGGLFLLWRWLRPRWRWPRRDTAPAAEETLPEPATPAP